MTKEEEKYTTLDTEQCKWWVITLFSMQKSLACQNNHFDNAKEIQSAQDKIIKALEITEEFEKAQIITGGRLNGRTYAYKCGLEDGKRKSLEQQPSDDCVSLEVYKQIVWERDIAIEQLKELGYSFGEKIRASDDCVSRQAVDKLCIRYLKTPTDEHVRFYEEFCSLPPVTPTQSWIPLVWDEYPTVDSDGNDDYVYAVDYSVPMPKEDEWVLITDENLNVRVVQYDGYDFGDYVREEILAWKHLPNPYIE